MMNNSNATRDIFIERQYTSSELNGTNVNELRAIAGQFNINGRHKMRKADLVNAILIEQTTVNSYTNGYNGRRNSGNFGSAMNAVATNSYTNGYNGRRNSGNFGSAMNAVAGNGYNAGRF